MNSSLPDGIERRHDIGMTNFDHSIDAGLDNLLRSNPNKVCVGHAAWNFHGTVWFDGEQFVEEVWTYGSPREVIKAGTIPELMEAVNSEYGYD